MNVIVSDSLWWCSYVFLCRPSARSLSFNRTLTCKLAQSRCRVSWSSRHVTWTSKQKHTLTFTHRLLYPRWVKPTRWTLEIPGEARDNAVKLSFLIQIGVKMMRFACCHGNARQIVVRKIITTGHLSLPVRTEHWMCKSAERWYGVQAIHAVTSFSLDSRHFYEKVFENLTLWC